MDRRQPTFIIAEAGVNHDGDPGKALSLVDAAADSGADAVKFQTFRAAKLVTPGACKAGYQQRTTGEDGGQLAMLKHLELDRDAHLALLARCNERDIRFLSSAFDLGSLAFLESLHVEPVKIPSGEITNLPYLRAVGALGREVLLSTGMADLEEVRAALEVLERAGTPRGRVVVLQCNTEYPTPLEHANLRAMGAMGEALGVRVGYSDHTVGIEASLAAAALGACVIEKHFTLDKAAAGPDHAASADPAELAALVRGVRAVEAALGSTEKIPSPSERANLHIARKYLVAARSIAEGEPFSTENLTSKRIGQPGVSPMRWDELLGRPSPRAYAPDEAIEA
jgi:N,N'-diacetyllegionaminate synthase